MQKKLSKSPLVYVIAQIKISPILKIEDYTSKLQEAIRKDFPLFRTVEIQFIDIKPQGNPEFKKNIQWHFIDKSCTTGIIIDSTSITIHTTNYNSFEDLTARFSGVLDIFSSILSVALYTRIGLRYVNFIHNAPKKYIHSNLLGFHLHQNDNIKEDFLIKSETIQETLEGIIKIQSSHFSNKSVTGITNIKDIILPLDLIQGATLLNTDIHNEKEPISNYAILDIDHFTQEDKKNEDFNVENIIKSFNIFHEIVYSTFKSAITSDAIKEWK